MSSVFNICGGENNSFTPAPRKIVPQGTLEITENGEYDVSQYASATVEVGGGGDDVLSDLIEGNAMDLVIPDGVVRIRNSAFRSFSRLRSIVMPASLNRIDDNAFRDCSGLQSITIKATAPPYVGNNVFPGVSTTVPIYVPAEAVDAYKASPYWQARASYIYAIS